MTLQVSQFHYLIHCSRQTVSVLATCLSEVGLTATATLNELGSLANHLTCIERVFLNEVVAHCYVQHRLVVRYGSDNGEQVLGYSLTQLEHEVLCRAGSIGRTAVMTLTPFTSRAF